MKLIDILVEELPKRGGWPEGAARLAQDPDGDIQMLSNRHAYLVSVGWTGDGRSDCYGKYAARKLKPLASDYDTAIITREQYEAALAAKNDGWIEWGGGECPVEEGVLVDVKHRDGEVYQNKPAIGDNNVCWSHTGFHGDIIAYRLHKPSEADKARASAWIAYAGITEADGEDDLNECIGQRVSPVWNGDGVIPPVGCICESSWVGDEWQQCEILFRSNQFVVVKLKESGMEDAYNIGDVIFRPIRPEAELKREEAVKAIMLTGWCQTAAEEIYDLVAAGKVPGMKLDD